MSEYRIIKKMRKCAYTHMMILIFKKEQNVRKVFFRKKNIKEEYIQMQVTFKKESQQKIRFPTSLLPF